MSTHHGILIHVVFSTKYRRRLILEPWQDELYGYIGGTAKDHKAVLLKAGGIEDHVYLLLKFHPQFAISKTIQLLKANSSKWLNEGKKTPRKFQWQRGYGAFSVSQSMVESVKRYISNQRQHHQKQTFEEEYFEMLRLHEIEFDPEFVFEREING